MLRTTNLSSGYGPMQVLNEITIHVPKGQVVSVVGANGAGKTTLLRTIAGLAATMSGEISLGDTAVQHLPAHMRVAVGISLVPEGRQLFPRMTVMDNMLVASSLPRSRERRKEMIERSLALFPSLRRRLNQLAGTLSGGEQQMVAVARGLMALPEVLMLDEPSLGLAPIVVQEIFTAITQLKNEGYTILLVEQNLHKALAVSDYAYVLENGSITQAGTPGEILANEDTRRAYVGI